MNSLSLGRPCLEEAQLLKVLRVEPVSGPQVCLVVTAGADEDT